MRIRKTHFPCRKPFGAIRLSHFSRIRLCRVSHSLPGATTEERDCGRLLLTSPGIHTHIHIHIHGPASCRRYEVCDLFDTYSKHSSDFRDVHSSSVGSPADLSISLRDAGFHRSAKNAPTSSAYSCSDEDHRREKNKEIKVKCTAAFGFRLLWSLHLTKKKKERNYVKNPPESVGFDIPMSL